MTDSENLTGAVSSPHGFMVDLSGFEGPLALLLSLAQGKKIDLLNISILDLAEQYLQFIDRVRQLRIEIAADYLVMASWLVYLKSRLLVTSDDESDDGEPSGEKMARELVLRLKKLDAMRKAAAGFADRPRLGRDFFPFGMPQTQDNHGQDDHYSNGYSQFLTCYADLLERRCTSTVKMAMRAVFTFQEARETLLRLTDGVSKWLTIDKVLVGNHSDQLFDKSVKASSFAACLELAREGVLQLHQDELFQPLYICSTRAMRKEASAKVLV